MRHSLSPSTMSANGLAVGFGKKHQVNTRTPAIKPSRSKGRKSEQSVLVRSLIREVVGFAPYEKRCLEMLRNDFDKKALKYAKRRLGTHFRAKKKREELQEIIRARRAAALKKEAKEKK